MVTPIRGPVVVEQIRDAPLPVPEVQSGGPTVPAIRPVPRTAEPERTRPRRAWLWAGGAVLAALIGALAYRQPWVTPPPVVVVETATSGPVTRVLAVNGRIEGERSVDLRPLVTGTLAAVLVGEGDEVAARAPVAQIDMVAQQAVVRQAIAGLDAALVAQDAARATLDRTRALGENAARSALDSAVRADMTAGQEVARMAALLDQARIALSRYTITAPLAGTVVEVPVDVGQTVDPNSVLMTIADLDHLVVKTDVDESYATQVRQGQAAALQLAGEAAVIAGRVRFVALRVDAATGGLAVTLAPDAALSAPIGLTVTANIIVDDRADAITVPRAAVVTDGAGTAVFVLSGAAVQRRAVTVIDWPAARLIVTEGLAPGDPVIVDATGLTDGQAVSVGQP